MIYEKEKLEKFKDNDVMVLDCTVRDGGFVNPNKFKLDYIKRIR